MSYENQSVAVSTFHTGSSQNRLGLVPKTLLGALFVWGLYSISPDPRIDQLVLVGTAVSLAVAMLLPDSIFRRLSRLLLDCLACFAGAVCLFYASRYAAAQASALWLLVPAALGIAWLLTLKGLQFGNWSGDSQEEDPATYGVGMHAYAESEIEPSRFNSYTEGQGESEDEALFRHEDESSDFDDSPFSDWDEPTPINPATGLPMIGGTGGVDICGNPFGFSDDHFHHHDSIGGSHESSIDHDFD